MSRLSTFFRLPARDPRYYQIAILSLLLVYGLIYLDFEVGLSQITIMMSTALITQYLYSRWAGLPKCDLRSAMISGLSLCLLLRTNLYSLMAIAAAITIASKFLIRWNGKHLFNPTNFGIVIMLILTDHVWVSPGQ
jgi:Na+-transporting NADH:ubiquinone oxidoreductase subunit NqrB